MPSPNFFTLGQLQWSWICSSLKRCLSVRSHEVLHRKSWKLVFLASEWVETFSKIYHCCASLGTQLLEITISISSIQHGEIRLQSSMRSKKTIFSIRPENVVVVDRVRSKKCWRWFPATEPQEKQETTLRSWRKFRLILRRERPVADAFGANNH